MVSFPSPMVVVVDDNVFDQEVASRTLRAAGYDVIATDRLSVSLAERADLLLIDLHLGQPESGMALAREARKKTEAAILLYSGSAEEDLKIFASACRADGYVHKADDGGVSTLITKIESALRRRGRVDSQVLVIDDEATDLAIARTLLGADGFSVTTRLDWPRDLDELVGYHVVVVDPLLEMPRDTIANYSFEAGKIGRAIGTFGPLNIGRALESGRQLGEFVLWSLHERFIAEFAGLSGTHRAQVRSAVKSEPASLLEAVRDAARAAVTLNRGAGVSASAGGCRRFWTTGRAS